MRKQWKMAGVLLTVLSLAVTGCAEETVLLEKPAEWKMEESVSTESSVEAVAEPEEKESVILGTGEFVNDNSYEYARQYMNTAEAVWYDEILYCIGAMESDFELSKSGIEAGLSEEDIDRIFQCVLMDHPELFYVQGYLYTKYTQGDELVSIQFSGDYTVDYEEAKRRKASIEFAAAAILEQVTVSEDEYEAVKGVYEAIIRSTEYDMEAPDNQNIYSVLVNHSSVCQGYAKTTQYLLNQLGIECTLIIGTVNTGEGHAWNLAKINDDYYFLDTTWGDASYQMSENGGTSAFHLPEVSYDYLNVTSEDMKKTHTDECQVPIPRCVATNANYYVREGAYFVNYDREQLKSLFDRLEEEGRGDFTLKCENKDCYDEIYNALINNKEIFDYVNGNDKSVAYAQNENQLSLTLWVTNK